MKNNSLSRETQILHQGAKIIGKRIDTPETMPIYMTTAFNVEDLDEVQALYSVKGYTYIRTRNPNRNALAELMTYLENGEDSIICSSGMAAITTTLFSMLKKGDHVVADQTLYGETLELFAKVFPGYGVEVSHVDFTNHEEVERAVRPNTRVFFNESVTNPMITLIDIEAIAKIAHSHGAKYIVDNTFTTSFALKPLDLGADVVVNSLTKFVNGHSDVCAGSATASKELIQKANEFLVLFGGTLDPFSAFMCQRGVRTMDLRLQKQMDNAAKLAKALEENPVVLKVFHPSLKSHPQHELAKRILQNGFGAMLSFELPEDRAAINDFMRRLKLSHYAMTLGGYRTTLAYPVLSSHSGQTREERLKMGITDGLMRISVGIENAEDLIADYNQALEAFK